MEKLGQAIVVLFFFFSGWKPVCSRGWEIDKLWCHHKKKAAQCTKPCYTQGTAGTQGSIYTQLYPTFLQEVVSTAQHKEEKGKAELR